MDTFEYMKRLPRKRVGAGALFFDESGYLLIVKPNYKDGWLVPGGTCNENESPRATCEREVLEEVGLEMKNPRLVCVDHTTDTKGYGDALQFLFYGGVLSEEEKKKIKLQTQELDEHRFVHTDEALKLLRAGLRGRLPECLRAIKNNEVFYLESIH